MKILWPRATLLIVFIGVTSGQRFASFRRRTVGLPAGFTRVGGLPAGFTRVDGLPAGLASSFGSRFRLSSDSLSPPRALNTWAVSPPVSSSLQSGSRVISSQGTRLVPSSNRILQAPLQGTIVQQPVRHIQPQQIQQFHSVQQPQQVRLAQPHQTRVAQPQQIRVTQPQQVFSQLRQVISQPRQVLSQNPVHTQPVAAVHHVAQPQVVRHTQTAPAPAVVQPQPAISHVTIQRGAPQGLAVPGLMPMQSPYGMGVPVNAMMGAMNPMMAGPMGMGMPFMSYDTMEDLFIDPDHHRMMPPPMAGARFNPVGMRPAVTAGAAFGAVAPAPASGAISMANVNPAIIQSALQAALGRVQQRQTAQAAAVG